MWKDSNRNIVVIFQPNILRTVGFYVRHWATEDIITYFTQLWYNFFQNANTKSMLQIESYFVKEVMNECVK